MMKDRPSIASNTLEEELFLALARYAKRAIGPVFLSAVIIAGLAWNYIAAGTLVGWLCAVLAILIIRRMVIPRLPTIKGLSSSQRTLIVILLSLMHGSIHAFSLVFFPDLPVLERSIQTMILAGLCMGAVATSAGYLPYFLAFILPILAPLLVLWTVSVGDPHLSWTNLGVAITITSFGAVLVAIARDFYRLFRESFEIRSQHIELNKQLRSALSEADAANTAKTRFLASASHDLRQPIHTLSLYGAALAVRPLDPRSRNIAEHMNLALQSLASQLDALLDISRLDAGVVDVNLSAVNLSKLLDRIRLELEPAAREKGLGFSVRCPAAANVETDGVLLDRILVNLVTNAIKYTDDGSIDITITAENSHYVIAVADTGCGIPASEQTRVFEEFYQLSNPHRDRRAGFGLGLSIVKRLARLLNIEMELRSKPGSGTVFKLVVPASQQLPTPDDQMQLMADAGLLGLHVLVVDDETEVVRSMRTLLEGMSCEVTTADSTSDAVSAVAVRQPDIVLVDFRLRDGDDGLTTIRCIRELHPTMPAILISGDTAPDRLRQANRAGVQLLHKPVIVEVLKRTIADACAGDTPVKHG